MVIAEVTVGALNAAYERLGYGMFVIVLTVAIGVAFALVVRPKK